MNASKLTPFTTEIIDLYTNKNYSANRLSNMYKVDISTIKKFLIDNRIPYRSVKEGIHLSDISNHRKDLINKSQDIVRYYKNGSTMLDVSKKFNCSDSIIKRILIDNGIKLKTLHEIKQKKAKKYNDEIHSKLNKNKAVIIKKYNEGTSIKQLCKLYNVTRKYIKNFLYNNKIIIRPSSKYHEYKFDEELTKYICDSYLDRQCSLKQLSIDLKIGEKCIRNLLLKNNIPIRTHQEAVYIIQNQLGYWDKLRKGMFSKKEYCLPSGKKIYLMGYEPQFLDYCFEKNIFNEEDFNFDDLTIIKYKKNNKIHNYYPDFYIPNYNLIIEIKSSYTVKLDKNIQLKEQAVKDAGYNYLFILDNDFSPLDKYNTQGK